MVLLQHESPNVSFIELGDKTTALKLGKWSDQTWIGLAVNEKNPGTS